MGPAYGSVTAPGSSKKVITVGASDMLDRISSVSGAGPTAECVCKPDLVAPGADVISCANKRNSYAIKSGTSMSTPKVSGAIALLLQKDPLLTNVEVKMLLRESCIDLGYPRNRQGGENWISESFSRSKRMQKRKAATTMFFRIQSLPQLHAASESQHLEVV